MERIMDLACECGDELKPGEDRCYTCLGETPPGVDEYLRERVSDFSRVGTEEWKEEMRMLWGRAPIVPIWEINHGK